MPVSKWRPVTSGSPGYWLGLVLFNIFAGDMDSGVKFAGNTKLCGAVNTGGKGCHPGDLDRPERWGCVNLMESSKPRAASSSEDMELEQVQREVMKMINGLEHFLMVPGLKSLGCSV